MDRSRDVSPNEFRALVVEATDGRIEKELARSLRENGDAEISETRLDQIEREAYPVILRLVKEHPKCAAYWLTFLAMHSVFELEGA
jgi:hypothetical protein